MRWKCFLLFACDSCLLLQRNSVPAGPVMVRWLWSQMQMRQCWQQRIQLSVQVRLCRQLLFPVLTVSHVVSLSFTTIVLHHWCFHFCDVIDVYFLFLPVEKWMMASWTVQVPVVSGELQRVPTGAGSLGSWMLPRPCLHTHFSHHADSTHGCHSGAAPVPRLASRDRQWGRQHDR